MSNPASGAFTASSLPADAVELGRIQDAWGIKGWVRILPYSADTSALIASPQWFLEPPEARFARGFSAFAGGVRVKVAEIKAAIANGTFQIDPDKIADGLIDTVKNLISARPA